jgi:membrane-bound lytic murein transglycosylase C
MKKYLKYVYSMLLTAMLSGPLCAAGTTCDAGLSSYLIADTSIDQKWEARKKALDARQQQAVSTMDARWLVSEKAFQEKWKKKGQEIEKKWQTAVRSTKKVWVNYGDGLESRSRVDFENGRIILEVVVPESDPYPLEKAKKAVKKLGMDVMAQKDITNQAILKNQVETSKGRVVDEASKEDFLVKEVIPKVKPSIQPFIPADGVKRRVYEAEITLVPHHIRIRAEKYLPLVDKYATINSLDPRLVLAVIHTESFFNPRAVSSCKAIGLMQIIPKFAGREAYKRTHGKDVVLAHDYYFDPEKNIEAGCKYLFILKTIYFKDIEGHLKNRYVAVCGYNWGPTIMRRKILDLYDFTSLSDQGVYNLLRAKTPEETRNYIQRVTQRMSIYDPYFN